METPKTRTASELVQANCSQVAFILAKRTRPDCEALAVDQLREAAATIGDLRASLLLFGVSK